LMQPYRESARKRNIKLEEIDLPRDHFEAQAKRRVALGLILSDIIQKNAIKLDDHRVRTAIEDMSQSYERPEDVINWYYADNSRLNDVRQMILENQAVDWVLGQAKTHEEYLTFNEVMNQNR
jgi:trigger factor